MTQILVSVRSPSEARLVCRYPVSIIDLKEPANGPLGRPSRALAESIADTVPVGVKKSIALGELHELTEKIMSSFRQTLARFQFAKIGLSGLVPDAVNARQEIAWQEHWESITALIPAHVEVVPVIYADWRFCRAPQPSDVLYLANRFDCKYALIDTFDKQRGDIFHSMHPDMVHELIRNANALELNVVLAGSINLDNLASVISLHPKWVGVRGVVCQNHNRGSRIDEKRLIDFVKAVEELSQHNRCLS